MYVVGGWVGGARELLSIQLLHLALLLHLEQCKVFFLALLAKLIEQALPLPAPGPSAVRNCLIGKCKK